MIGYVWSELSLFAEKIDTFCNRNRIAIGTLGGLIFGAISAFYWCFAAHHSELLNTNFIGLPMMFTIMAVICFSSVFIKAMTSNPSIETEGFEEKSQKSLTS